MYRESTRNAPRHLYIARDGTVVARDEISGAVRWRSTLADRKNQVSSGKMRCVADGDDVLVFGAIGLASLWSADSDRACALACLNATTGVERWRVSFAERTLRDGFLPATMLVTAESIFVEDRGSIVAVDRSNGKIRWIEAGDEGTPAALAVEGQSVAANAS
jgi:outer membrane protein assembly factor BamB